jgi:hypothetical protein
MTTLTRWFFNRSGSLADASKKLYSVGRFSFQKIVFFFLFYSFMFFRRIASRLYKGFQELNDYTFLQYFTHTTTLFFTKDYTFLHIDYSKFLSSRNCSNIRLLDKFR